MNKKRFVILSLVLGVAFVLSTAFASAASVWKTDIGFVYNKLIVGKNNNKGKLYVKGLIRNPVKGKSLKLDDSVNVTKNLKVGGILQGNNIVSSDNLGTGVVTGAKIASGAVTGDKIGTETVGSDNIASGAVTGGKMDFSMNGVVKAAAYGTPATCNDTALSRSFNNLTTTSVTCSHDNTGIFTVDFGAAIDERFVQVTPLKNGIAVFSTISSQAGNSVVLYFYNNDTGNEYNPDGFYVTLY